MSLSSEEQVPDPAPYQYQASAPPAFGYPAGSGGVPPERDRRTGLGRTLGVCLLVAAVIAGSGFLLGWLWSELAPRVVLTKVEGGFVYAETEPEQPVAADGWFLLIGLGAGLLVGLLAWTLRRYRGALMLVAIVAGSLGAAWIAWWFGRRLGWVDLVKLEATTPNGQNVDAPLGLRITNMNARDALRPALTGVLAVQALAAAFIYTALAGFSRYASLRGPDPLPLPSPAEPMAYRPPFVPFVAPPPVENDQFGPGRTGSSESGTGTALT